MSELSRNARRDMRAKAHRMAEGADPHEHVDGSSWTPAEAMHADKQTGERPISRRQYRRGGKVEGEHHKAHAGKKPRAKGGRLGRDIADDYVNRDVRAANEEREGVKHVGGFKRGGAARREHRDVGGPLAPAISNQGRLGSFNYPARTAMFKDGGKTGAREHRDIGGELGLGLLPAQGKRGALGAVGLKRGGKTEKCSGGQTYAEGGKVEKAVLKAHRLEHRALAEGKAHGGGIDNGTRPKGGREARAHGGHLTAEERRHIPKSEFGEPGERKYPMPDKSHAANAKARAGQAVKAGRMSRSTEERIDAKANRVLERASGGRATGGRAGKGKMSVNIVIAPGHGGAPQPPMGAAPQGMPPPRPPVMPVPTPPPAGASPVGPMGAMPMPFPVPMGGGAPQPMTGMGRRRGGRAGAPAPVDMDHGAGGGLGRLEKVRRYGHRAEEHDGNY